MPFLAERSVPISNQDILSWIFDHAKYDLDQPLYVDAINPARSISGRQAYTIIRKLAAGLTAAGLHQGDCVAIHAFNDIYYPMLVMGIVAAGGIFTGTNPSWTPFELTQSFATSGTKFVFVEPDLLPAILAATSESSMSNSSIWIFNPEDQNFPEGFASWTSLLHHGERDWIRFDDENTSRATTVARLYTSGTTGLPKAAALTHYNLVAQHIIVNEAVPLLYEVRRLIYLPMFHAAMVPSAHVAALRSGYPNYVLRRFDLEQFLWSIHNHKISELIFVPPVAMAVINYRRIKRFSLKSIRAALCGAGPLDKDNQNALQDLLAPESSFTQGWGMTETSCAASRFYYPEKDDTGSIGRMMPNLDVKIIDDEGKDMSSYNNSGELCIRGPTIIMEYYNNPAATAASFDQEGYFKTGDIMYCSSKDKKWYIVDRKKELIKVRGFQVAPAEIEGVLLTHPDILDTAVIGVPDKIDFNIEHPRAYVVCKPDTKVLGEAEVKFYCGERLAKYKELTGGVSFIDSIPRNATGKALKRILRDLAKTESLTQAAKL